MNRFRLPPPKPRGPAEYRNTKIDVFVGGPLDGQVRHIPPHMHEVRVASYSPMSVADYDADPLSMPPFSVERYRTTTFRSDSGQTIATVTFWLYEGITPEMALLKLCLGYHPELVPDAHVASAGK